MFNTDFLLKLINKEKASKYIYTLLLISLTSIFEFIMLFYFSKMMGLYLYMAIIASLSLLGVFLTISMIKKQITILEKKHRNGVYPENEFYCITTLFFASIFIIFPGGITSFIGLGLISVPYFRILIGRTLSRSLQLDWNSVYEYKEIYSN